MHNILKTKQKQKQEQVQETRTKPMTRFVLNSIALSAIGIFGRAAFQTIPSIEPLLALGIVACYVGGAKYAIPMAGSYFSSNFFVYGGPGPWAIFQAMGMFFAGLMATSFRRTKKPLAYALVAGTIVFEICVNSSWIFLTGINSLFFAFVPAIPFSIVHLSSTVGFGMLFKGIGIEKLMEARKSWTSNMR